MAARPRLCVRVIMMILLGPCAADKCSEKDGRGEKCSASKQLVPGKLQVWPAQPLPAQIFLPKAATAGGGETDLTRWPPLAPVLVFLHGAPPDGRFDEPSSESLRGLLQNNATFAQTFPFVVLFPCSTCDRDGRPLRVSGPPPVDGNIGWTKINFAYIDRMVEAAINAFGGDPSRVHLTGASYGGRGVWDYGVARPSMFAALVPVCPSSMPTPEDLDALCCRGTKKHIRNCCAPVWAFHGENDVRADVQLTDMWVRGLRAQSYRPVSSPRACSVHTVCKRASTPRRWARPCRFRAGVSK